MYVHRYGGRQSQTPRPGPISRRLDRSGPGVGRSGPRSTRSGRPPRQARSSAHARNVIGEAPHPAPVHAARARPRGETPITQCMQKIKATTSTSTARSIWAAHEGKAGPCVHVPVCVSSACLYTHAPCTCPSLLGCRRLCPPAMPTGNHPTGRAHERVHVHVHALVGHHRHRAYVPPDGLLPPPPSRDRPGVGVPCAPGPGPSGSRPVQAYVQRARFRPRSISTAPATARSSTHTCAVARTAHHRMQHHIDLTRTQKRHRCGWRLRTSSSCGPCPCARRVVSWHLGREREASRLLPGPLRVPLQRSLLAQTCRALLSAPPPRPFLTTRETKRNDLRIWRPPAEGRLGRQLVLG